MTTETVAPVRKQVTVEVPAERAFDFFTAQMASWWKPDHSIGERPFVSITMEPHVGGRWFETDADGNECPWGEVRVWDPPYRVVVTWQLSAEWRFDPDVDTELEVRFVPDGPGRTVVELEHRGLEYYGEAAPQMFAVFDSPDGWSGLLERMAGLV